jgi:cellulose synthase/poly-beta-1,6-N-acetylglucosamine synthase-like glycosyltransferase
MILLCTAIAAFLSLWYLVTVLLLRVGLRRLGGPSEPAGLSYSVVIAARNEHDNITACLDTVLAQSLPEERYEVIVVDDRSTDDTRALAEKAAAGRTGVTVLAVDHLPAGSAPKKHAVSVGVAAARHPVVLFTDADCRVPSSWLESIDRHFAPDVGVVQGITSYPSSDDGGFLLAFQAIDFLSHGIVAAGGIGAGLPINSNANNLAIRREALLEAGGYGESAGVVSGDDDLLVQRVWRSRRWRIRFMTDPTGAVETFPQTTIGDMLNQRAKWGSATIHYGLRQRTLLAGVFLFYCAILALLAAGFYDRVLAALGAAMYCVKLGGELLLMFPGTRLFGRRRLRRYIVPASLLQLPVVVLAVMGGVFGRFGWKGQRLGRRMPGRTA